MFSDFEFVHVNDSFLQKFRTNNRKLRAIFKSKFKLTAVKLLDSCKTKMTAVKWFSEADFFVFCLLNYSLSLIEIFPFAYKCCFSSFLIYFLLLHAKQNFILISTKYYTDRQQKLTFTHVLRKIFVSHLFFYFKNKAFQR